MRPLLLVPLTVAMLGLSSAPAGAVLIYETGFEDPPVVVGVLAGQDGWIDAGSPSQVTVQTGVVLNGEQAVQMNAFGATPGDQLGVVHGDGFDTESSGIVTVIAHVNRSGPDGASSLGAEIAGFTGDGVNIGFMRWWDDDTLSIFHGGGSVDFPSVFTKNTWYEVGLAFDFTDRTFDALLDGGTVATDLPFLGGTDNTEWFGGGLFVQGAGDDNTYWDDYNVDVAASIPEPAHLTLLGLGALSLLVRRRSS